MSKLEKIERDVKWLRRLALPMTSQEDIALSQARYAHRCYRRRADVATKTAELQSWRHKLVNDAAGIPVWRPTSRACTCGQAHREIELLLQDGGWEGICPVILYLRLGRLRLDNPSASLPEYTQLLRK